MNKVLIAIGIAGTLALIGWMAFASRHNGKPAYVPPTTSNLTKNELIAKLLAEIAGNSDLKTVFNGRDLNKLTEAEITDALDIITKLGGVSMADWAHKDPSGMTRLTGYAIKLGWSKSPSERGVTTSI